MGKGLIADLPIFFIFLVTVEIETVSKRAMLLIPQLSFVSEAIH
jgi:hypothetical protein